MSSTTPRPGKVLEIVPPEGVAVSFSIATIGSRFGAQFIDATLTTLVVGLMLVVLQVSALFGGSAKMMLLTLISFFTRVPYYICSELIWNGRTIGKRLIGIRVINMQGQRLTPHQIVARNLMKEAEFFVPLSMLGVSVGMSALGKAITLLFVFCVAIVPFANRRRQRLGDMVAGTVVVDHPHARLLPDLALAVVPHHGGRAISFLPDQLNVYGRFELQTLEELLRDPRKAGGEVKLREITMTIARKIGYDGLVRPGEELEFLNAFYRAQREHLETLRLFGKRRENKFETDERGEGSAPS